MLFSLRELALAIKRGRAGVIRDYLSQGGDPDYADPWGYSLLHKAAYEKRLPIVKRLVKAGADVNAKDYHQRRPLTEAIRIPFNALLDRWIVPWKEVVDFDLAHLSRELERQFQVASYLVSAGAEVNVYRGEENVTQYAATCFRPPLMLAAEAGNVAAVRLFLEHNADLEALDYHNCTALVRAVRSGLLPIVKLLVEAGANVNGPVGGPLPLLSGSGDGAADRYAPHYKVYPEEDRQKIATGLRAIFDNYRAIMQYLIDVGADVNTVGFRGTTALLDVVSMRRSDLLLMVIAAGADVYHRDDNGNTALHCLVKGDGAGHASSKEEEVEILRILLDAGVERDARDGEGKTAVEWALEKGKSWLTSLLLG
jgi:ankyrin repeat protein